MQFRFHIYILWQSKFIKKLTLNEKKKFVDDPMVLSFMANDRIALARNTLLMKGEKFARLIYYQCLSNMIQVAPSIH